MCIRDSGMGGPGPVEFGSGLLVAPPIMPGWEGFSIREYLREEYRAPAFIDNDVNVMAMGELWRLHRKLPNFIVLKIGTGTVSYTHLDVYKRQVQRSGNAQEIITDSDEDRCGTSTCLLYTSRCV